MQLVNQYRTVAFLAAASTLATLFYSSTSSRISVGQEEPSKHTYQSSGSSWPLKNQNQNGKLVSENNARIAAINSKAFVHFCNAKNDDEDLMSKNDSGLTEFASFQEWIKYINSNTSVNTSDSPDDNIINKLPRFLERPLDNWIVNLTAIQEPCNRLVHTSAHCLDYLSQEHKYLIPSKLTSSPRNMDYHVFWRGPITDKLYLSAHSFLFTQPLNRSKLHLWIDSADLPGGVPEDYTKNKYAASLVSEPLNRFIQIHAWDQAAELAYSYGKQQKVESFMNENKRPPQRVKPVALSDEARFLILNRNGGIYLDADVLLLKDMSPFFDSGLEFAYEWSNTRLYNTAVLRLFPGSSVARRILDGAKAREAEIMDRKAREKLVLEAEAEGDREEEKAKVATEEDSEEEEDEEEAAVDYDEKEASSGQQDSILARHPKDRTKEASLPKLSKREMRPEEIYHPARLRGYLRPQDSAIEGNGLIMMPSALFDPLWLRVDGAEAKNTKDTEKMLEDLHSFPEAFSATDAVCPAQSMSSQETAIDFSAGPEVFVTGAYAYHWHNSWSIPIRPKSWMGLMLKAYEDFVSGQRQNQYGEWFEDNL
ncbi:hypothetical protein BGZ80_005428 [Entomortierella chlamydospora]|uniref:Glycosyltransferase family 32 protein n=1 Tax=Entomortierella chlamydospora TaxID=101097 RepID=A0A9P6MKD8_9FUNG|nr:hypothetical protein BGZ79_003091 [Entomortierella chlamydospora]KAG0005534.1 hypothetical protein BGZ80_005428 [Entomortierella chlamydospora]